MPTPQELVEPATHIMLAMCCSAEIDKENPENIVFYFLPIKPVLGELEEVADDPGMMYYGYYAIKVVGNVSDYRLDDVYSAGGTYELYLEKHTAKDGSIYYSDLLPYSEVRRVQEVREFYHDETYLSNILQLESDRIEAMERMKEYAKVYKYRPTNSQTTSTEE